MEQFPLNRLTVIQGRGWGIPIVFMSASGVAFFLHYTVQVVMGNLLGVVQFGELGFLISILTLASLPAAGLDLMVTKSIANQLSNPTSSQIRINHLLKTTIFFGSVFTIIVIALIPLFDLHLEQDSFLLAILVAFAALFSYLMAFGTGLLRGQQRFYLLSFMNTLYPALRIAFSVFLVVLGLEIVGAVTGTLISLIIAAAFASFLGLAILPKKLDPDVSSHHNTNANESSNSSTYAFGFLIIAVTVSLAVVGTVDVILVNTMATAEDAGLFVMASTIGRGGIALFAAIGLFIFPKVAARSAVGENHIDLLSKGLGIGLILWAVPALIIGIFARDLISAMFGSEFVEGANLLRWYIASITPFAVISIVARYNLASGNRFGTISLFVFTVLLIGAMILTAGNPMRLVGAIGAVSSVYCLVLLANKAIFRGLTSH